MTHQTITLIALGVLIAFGAIKSFVVRGPINWGNYSGSTPVTIPAYQAILSIFASFVGSFMVFGLPQVGAQGGLTGYILGLAYILGMPLLGMAYNKAHANGCASKGLFGIDELLREKFGNKTSLAFYILTSLLFAGVLAAQFVALHIYLQEFTGAASLFIVLGIGLVATVLYTLIYGFRGVIQNDVVQGILTLLVAFFVVGWVAWQAHSSGPINFNPLAKGIGGSYGLAYPLLGFATLLPCFFVRADVWNRIRLVPQAKVKSVLLTTGLLMFFFYAAMTSVGVIASQNPGAFPFLSASQPETMVVRLVHEVDTNVVSRVLCLAGILFALLSSIDSYLNLVSVAITRVLLWGEFNRTQQAGSSSPPEAETRLVWNARVATVGVAATAGLFAFLVPDLVDLLSASFTGLGLLLPICLVALFGKRKVSDFVGYVPVFLGIAILFIAFPFLKKLSFIPAIGISLLLFLILWLFNRKKTSN